MTEPIEQEAAAVEPAAEPEPEPKVSRPRIGAIFLDKLNSIDDKLDSLLGQNTELNDEAEDEGQRPEVSFAPEPSQLPTTAELPAEEAEEAVAESQDDAGTGQGTANTPPPVRRHGFPHRRRSVV